MANALKIEIQTGWSGTTPVYGETLYFDEDEYRGCVITNNARCEILESLKHAPDVYDGTKYNAEGQSSQSQGRIISIDIYQMYSSTKTTLDTLFDYKNLLKVYYKYITDPTAFVLCLLDPINKEHYVSGEQQAAVISKLTFYETSDYGSSGTSSLYLTGGISIIPEVIIDPDDKNIKLDGVKDLISISNIIQKIDIEPGRSGIIENNDIFITINNANNYCIPYKYDTSITWNPFRIATGFLRGGSSAGATNVVINLFGNSIGVVKFKQGDIVILANGTNYETKLISSVEDVNFGGAPVEWGQRLTFSTVLSYSYVQDDPVQTWSFIGKTVNVNLRFENEYQYGTKTISTITVYKGKIRETPKVNDNTATLIVEPFSNSVMSAPLLIKNSAVEESAINRCSNTGTFPTSIGWVTQAGSGTLSAVTIYANAVPGYWEVTFSSATNFTVTGTNCESKAGTTASDFYDQTDATDSQIKIASASWGDTPASGDILGFYDSVNYNNKSVPAIIYDILINQYGLTASDIDPNTIFTGAGGGASLYISFSESQTLGDVISAVLSGQRFYLSQTYDGKFKLAQIEQFEYDGGLSSVFTTLDSTHVLPSVILKEHNLNVSDIYNEIIVYYGWDYSEGTYQFETKYPLADSSNRSYAITAKKRTVSLYVPGVYSKAVADDIATDTYNIHAYGNYLFNGKVCLTMAQYITPGYLYKHQAINTYGIYVTEKELDINNCEISVRGFNLKKRPSVF